jgi:hypothetical protein
MPAYAMACPRLSLDAPGSEQPPQANPSGGPGVLMSPFSGPKGSPFDKDSGNNTSTGALSTGIGFGVNTEVPGINAFFGPALPAGNAKPASGFTDDYQPGITLPSGVAATTAILTAIGGGRSTANTDVSPTTPNPYVAQPLLAWGNGGNRDAGAGPAYTGFGTKSVTASADVANGAAIEAGWLNRQGVTLKSGLSQFGSATAASPAVT